MEDKPDVTYEEVGGAKESIKKLREVSRFSVLLVVAEWFDCCATLRSSSCHSFTRSALFRLVLIHPRVFCCMGPLEPEKRCLLVQWQTELM